MKVHGVAWLPEGEPKAVICLVHGHGEHIGRYEHVGSFFASNGVGVFGMDLRGHGLSQGKKGHTPSYEHLLEDVEDLMKTARVEFIEAPLFLYGHSMGGNIVANFLTNRKTLELHGAILSSPWLRLAFQPSGFKLKLGRFLRKVLPSITIPSELDVNGISSVPEEVEKYKKDPLVHNKISPMLSLSVMDAGEKAIERAGELNIPVLAFHGSSDPITSHLATKEFADAASAGAAPAGAAPAGAASGFVKLRLWEGLKHELHNDKKAGELLEEILIWIKSNSGER